VLKALDRPKEALIEVIGDLEWTDARERLPLDLLEHETQHQDRSSVTLTPWAVDSPRAGPPDGRWNSPVWGRGWAKISPSSTEKEIPSTTETSL
jgi:hypothetical protein